jgi:hypothetical protein
VQAFYAPTVSQAGGVQSVVPGVVHTNGQTFFAPTVATGSIDLAAPLLSNSQQFYAPGVSIGSASLAPPLAVNGQVFYTATVTPGAITLAPTRIDNTAANYAPSVSTSNDVAAPFLSNASTLFVPLVGVGSVGLQAPLLLNAQQVFAPVVDNGTYSLTSSQAQALYQVYLLHGLKIGAPLTVSQTQRMAGGLEQAITEGGGSVTITTTVTPYGAGLNVGAMVEELAQWYGLPAPVTLTPISQIGGAVSLALATEAGTTTAARQ